MRYIVAVAALSYYDGMPLKFKVIDTERSIVNQSENTYSKAGASALAEWLNDRDTGYALTAQRMREIFWL